MAADGSRSEVRKLSMWMAVSLAFAIFFVFVLLPLFALGTLLLVVAGAVWWRSLELNARALPECREKLIEVLARSSDD